MATLLELFKSSAIVQGVIALLLIGGIVYQVIAGQAVSDTLLIMANVVLGFYFGSKTQQVITAANEARAVKKGG